MNILKFLFGTKNDRELKRLWPIVREINRIEGEYQAKNFADEDYPRMTQEFKDRIAKGETLDHILPEAFALVKNACRHLCGTTADVCGHQLTWNMVPFDVQLIGGIVLHRGNISEIKTLALGSGTTKGVDADVADAVTEDSLDGAVKFARDLAAKTGAIIAITGAIDLVADADRCYVIRNGRPEMGRITGTGCQLSGMMTAFLVANPDTPLDAAAAAVCTMGLAGEIGWSRMQEGDGNSTYRNRIIDAIYNMDGTTLDAGAKYEIR